MSDGNFREFGEGEGMSEWQEYLLEDVIEKFIDYRGKKER